MQNNHTQFGRLAVLASVVLVLGISVLVMIASDTEQSVTMRHVEVVKGEQEATSPSNTTEVPNAKTDVPRISSLASATRATTEQPTRPVRQQSSNTHPENEDSDSENTDTDNEPDEAILETEIDTLSPAPEDTEETQESSKHNQPTTDTIESDDCQSSGSCDVGPGVTANPVVKVSGDDECTGDASCAVETVEATVDPCTETIEYITDEQGNELAVATTPSCADTDEVYVDPVSS